MAGSWKKLLETKDAGENATTSNAACSLGTLIPHQPPTHATPSPSHLNKLWAMHLPGTFSPSQTCLDHLSPSPEQLIWAAGKLPRSEDQPNAPRIPITTGERPKVLTLSAGPHHAAGPSLTSPPCLPHSLSSPSGLLTVPQM